MLIVLGGLPGTGRQASREPSRRRRAVHIRIDSIEQAIRESAVTVVSLDDAGYRAGYAMAEDNLRLGHLVVADSVNPVPITRGAWLDVARRANARAIEVEVQSSDQSSIDAESTRVCLKEAAPPGSKSSIAVTDPGALRRGRSTRLVGGLLTKSSPNCGQPLGV
jgi:hypothetical protein